MKRAIGRFSWRTSWSLKSLLFLLMFLLFSLNSFILCLEEISTPVKGDDENASPQNNNNSPHKEDEVEEEEQDFDFNKIDQIFEYLTDVAEVSDLDVKVETKVKAALKKNKHSSSSNSATTVDDEDQDRNQISSDEYTLNEDDPRVSHKKNLFNYSYHHLKPTTTKPPNNNGSDGGGGHKPPPNRFFKRLKVPKGSEMSLSFQVSRPNILPGFFFQPDAIIMDAVLDFVLLSELDVFANEVYTNPYTWAKPPNEEEYGRSILGLERCFLYSQLETLAARIMQVSEAVAHVCVLRTICELHSMLRFRPDYEHASIIFELIRLFMTPSLGHADDCYKPYVRAERIGRHKALCYTYTTKCPIAFLPVILQNFIPSFLL